MPAALTITVGIPGSGKSRYAAATLQDGEFDVVFSTDEIRQELTGDMTSMERNQDVFKLLRRRVDDALVAGLRVLVDATNLLPAFRADFLEIAKVTDAPTWAVVFGDSWDYDLCQSRNVARDRVVPEDVMKKMHADFMEHCRIAVLHMEGWQLEIVSTIKENG